MTLNQAFLMFADWGGINRDMRMLYTAKPSLQQVEQSRDKVIEQAKEAFRLITEYYKIDQTRPS